jgi:3-deoxy-manno-octulosonate cytidylyltransferase (CMP-KDO synthetase)
MTVPTIVAVIPARMGSSRFPGKPLAPILGLPMLEHVRRRVELCPNISSVYVATCDTEIADAVNAFGGQVLMTSSRHERASDRVAEVATSIDADIYVMVQGDEPLVTPQMVTLALAPLMQDSRVVCSNLAAPIETEADFLDPNTIKVVMAQNGDALYFSRQPIPTSSRTSFRELRVFKQVCVIPFRRDFLHTYTALPQTPLEIAESIDMLRALEHGYPIRLVVSPYTTQSVDRPDEIARVEALMRLDPHWSQYAARQ